VPARMWASRHVQKTNHLPVRYAKPYQSKARNLANTGMH